MSTLMRLAARQDLVQHFPAYPNGVGKLLAWYASVHCSADRVAANNAQMLGLKSGSGELLGCLRHGVQQLAFGPFVHTPTLAGW